VICSASAAADALQVPRNDLASFLPQRHQKQHDTDCGQNDGDDKARGRDFGAGMIVFFEMPSEAYQERKNANAAQN
jgi:hypothetical protein